MTRYTKLDGRKALHKATDLSAPKAIPSVQEQPTPSTSTTPLQHPASAASTSASAVNGNGGDESQSVPTDPKKLQSRLKLLRLKIKNAKTEQKKESLRAELAEVQRGLHTANGHNGNKSAHHLEGNNDGGGGGKRKRSDGSTDDVRSETNPWKKMEAERRAKTSATTQARREKRIAERNMQTRCFACRGMGHAAKDCPEALNSSTIALQDDHQVDEKGTVKHSGRSNPSESLIGKETVGICFRCGSTQHILARCRRPAPQVGSDLPFATCFVCQEKGHLSSKCPSNTAHGVYPNGGCCKLCSSVEHLAKDCELRSSSTTAASNASMVGGSARGERQAVGADDDDFIEFARRKVEVDREEKRDLKRQNVGASKATAPPKKVVSF